MLKVSAATLNNQSAPLRPCAPNSGRNLHLAIQAQENLPPQRGIVAPCPPPASVFASPLPRPSSAPPSASGPPASSSALPGAFHSAAVLAALALARRFLVQLWGGETGRSNSGKLRTWTVGSGKGPTLNHRLCELVQIQFGFGLSHLRHRGYPEFCSLGMCTCHNLAVPWACKRKHEDPSSFPSTQPGKAGTGRTLY